MMYYREGAVLGSAVLGHANPEGAVFDGGVPEVGLWGGS